MSTHAYPIIWAMKHAPVVDREERLILWELADAADPDGCDAFRSVGNMADRAMCSPETVNRRLRSMNERGLIRKQRDAPNKASWLAQPNDKKTTAWELAIPYSWWSDTQREDINQLRAERGANSEPITPDNRPDLAPTEQRGRKARADKGKPNPKRSVSKTGRSDERGVLQTGRGVSHRQVAGCLGDTQPSGSDLPGGTTPPSPPAREADPSETAQHEGGGGDLNQETTTNVSPLPTPEQATTEGNGTEDEPNGHEKAARDLLASLPRQPWRLSKRQIDQLVPHVAAALSDATAPWDADDLYEHITSRSTAGIGNHFSVLSKWLRELPLPPVKTPEPDRTPCRFHPHSNAACPQCIGDLKVEFGPRVDWSAFPTPADACDAWLDAAA